MSEANRAGSARGRTAARPVDRLARPLPLATTRRGFLRLAGTTAAFATLANPRLLSAAGLRESVPGAPFFSPGEAEILTAVAERMVGVDAPDAPTVRETRAVAAIDRLCRGLDPELTRALPALLRLVEYGPLVFDFEPSRFTRLDAEAQHAHLAGWMQSRFRWRRLGFQALRNLSFLGYYSQDETWPAIGYAGPLIARPEGAT